MTIKLGDIVKVLVSWQIGYGKTGTVVRVARNKSEIDVDFGEFLAGIYSVEKIWCIPAKDVQVVKAKEGKKMAMAMTRAVLRNVLRYITSTGTKGITWDTDSWVEAKRAVHMSNIELAEAVRFLLKPDALGVDTGVKVVQPQGKGTAFIAAKAI